MKSLLRAEFKALRDSLPKNVSELSSEEICARLTGTSEFIGAAVIFVYCSFGSEADTGQIIRASLRAGKTVAVPRLGEHRVMHAVLLSDPSELTMGAFGIKTVEKAKNGDGDIIDPRAIDLCVVPGIAFDRSMHRLGQGGGYYDRYLKTVRTDCVKAGVAFSCQIAENVPSEPYDVLMDMIVTEKEIILDNF